MTTFPPEMKLSRREKHFSLIRNREECPVVTGHPVVFGRPSTRTRQGPSFPGEEDGFDLARSLACLLVQRTKRSKPMRRGGTLKRSVCGARLMVRRSMNSLPLTPSRFTSTDHLADLAVVRPRSDDFVGLLDGGRARPAASIGCPESARLGREVAGYAS